MICDCLVYDTPKQAFESLVDSRYGFNLLDLGRSSDDFLIFDQLAIDEARHIDLFCTLNDLDEQVGAFLEKMGPNTNVEVIDPSVKIIHEIATSILSASGKQYAWVFLRANPPTTMYDLPRWHMDGYYFRDLTLKKLQVKFITSLVGPSTMFYRIKTNSLAERNYVWHHMINRKLMSEYCTDEPVIFHRGVGAFFIAANHRLAAIHSEPPIHENRLVLSIVPCDEEDLPSIKKRVLGTYKESR